MRHISLHDAEDVQDHLRALREREADAPDGRQVQQGALGEARRLLDLPARLVVKVVDFRLVVARAAGAATQ